MIFSRPKAPYTLCTETRNTMDENHQPLPETRQPLVSRTLTEWKTLAILGGPILIAQLAQMVGLSEEQQTEIRGIIDDMQGEIDLRRRHQTQRCSQSECHVRRDS